MLALTRGQRYVLDATAIFLSFLIHWIDGQRILFVFDWNLSLAFSQEARILRSI
jgi:hypothetical protein